MLLKCALLQSRYFILEFMIQYYILLLVIERNKFRDNYEDHTGLINAKYKF